MSGRPRETPDPRLSLTPVVRGGLTDRVIDQLRERIGAGIWPLNSRLPVEAALAKELGVGRSTVREAVRVLVHAGMLEVRQGDGTFVRSRREIDAALRRRVLGANLLEAFEVRRGLEVEVARSAALHRSETDATRLVDLAAQRVRAHDVSADASRRADLALRECLLDATGNVLLADLYRGFVEPLHAALAARSLDDAELTRDDPSDPESVELAAAVAAGDPEAAAAAALRWMDSALRVLRLLVQAVEHRR